MALRLSNQFGLTPKRTDNMTPMEWLMSGDTGVSSKTIFSVMTSTPSRDNDVPYDAGDFGRCYRLLQAFPLWRLRLFEVAEKFPIWGPMVAAWDELTVMYEEGLRTKWTPNNAAMYERMRQLVDAGRLADGWENPSPGYWRKGKASEIEITGGVSIRT